MSNDPILILQMQRLGDLALSFPLLESLCRLFPGNPLQVVGERVFFEPLKALGPRADYIDYSEAAFLRGKKFHAVINLSHRKEAAALAAATRSEAVIGPRLDAEGRLLIHGDWQLYRASLTHNNRYNLFHWSDLNCLDVIPAQLLAQYKRPLPRAFSSLPAPQRARVGLFLGASEAAKRPSAEFWAELANLLLRLGLRPVLLGGAAEAQMGADVAKMLNAPALNLCGNFTIASFSRFIKELALVVSPDTGPMHVAVLTGTPVLNLSMGPVNAWETGPASPGHHVVRAKLPCSGCWACSRDRLYCHEAMRPQSLAGLASLMLSGNMNGKAHDLDEDMELLRTGRSGKGLYKLALISKKGGKARENAGEEESAAQRQALSFFWQAWFGNLFGLFEDHAKQSAWQNLKKECPQTADNLKAAAAALAVSLARTYKSDPALLLQDPDFWRRSPSILHPFSGYLQMYAQNALGSREAFVHIVSLAERLAEAQ